LFWISKIKVSVNGRNSPLPRHVINSFGSVQTRVAQDYLGGVDEQTAHGSWRLTFRGKEAFTAPMGGVIRSLMLNHWYHHRGQLTVYLRLLDVPVPVIYGRRADENPFV